MKEPSELYDPEWLASVAAGSIVSASLIVPLVLEQYPDIHRVIDVGCGEGWWGREFERAGCEVLGIDGEWIDKPVIPFRVADLEKPLIDVGQFDLAVCLEVAEHLTLERAAGLVRDVCQLAPVILWSAATPGQGGIGHMNEQWPSWWASHFRRNRYGFTDTIRSAVRYDRRIETWYAQNTFIIVRDEEIRLKAPYDWKAQTRSRTERK